MVMLEKHRDFFKDLFKLKDTDPVPAHVTKLYETARQLADRKDVPLSDQTLLVIAILAGEVLNMSNLVASIPVRKVAKASEPAEKPVQSTITKPEPQQTAAVEKTEMKPQTVIADAPKIDGVPCIAFSDGVEKSGVLLNTRADASGMCKVVFAGETMPTLVSTNNVKVQDGEGNYQWLNPR